MTNWSLSYQQNLASPQHGDLRMVGLVSLQFRVPTVHFPSKLDRNCISFCVPVLAVRLHHSCNILVVQAVTAWQDSWWEERDAQLSSERVSKYLWPSKKIAKTNTLTINYLYSATWKIYSFPLPRFPKSHPTAAATQSLGSDHPNWVQVQMNFLRCGSSNMVCLLLEIGEHKRRVTFDMPNKRTIVGQA